MIKYKIKDNLERDLFSLSIPSIETPLTLTVPGQCFTCFVACDASRISEDVLLSFANTLLSAGVVYVVAWGPNCRSVEDAVDHADVSKNMEKKNWPVVMTTSHPDETLEEALRFFLTWSIPDEAFIDKCKSALAITVGNPDWENKISSCLADPSGLPDEKL